MWEVLVLRPYLNKKRILNFRLIRNFKLNTNKNLSGTKKIDEMKFFGMFFVFTKLKFIRKLYQNPMQFLTCRPLFIQEGNVLYFNFSQIRDLVRNLTCMWLPARTAMPALPLSEQNGVKSVFVYLYPIRYLACVNWPEKWKFPSVQ